jgi:glycine/D-amino acid oxidase-like deaminating enzyme
VLPPHSLWWSTLKGPVTPRAALDTHLDVDVAIVGGGFTGLWTARELMRRDPTLRVVVLEQAVCGFGASGRNGGWASSFYPMSDHAVISRHGHEAFLHLRRQLQRGVSALGEAVASDGIDADYVQGGTMTFARSELQSQRLQKHVHDAHDLGYASHDLEWLNAHEAAERGRVTRNYGATYSPHCARIHPARLVRGLADANERLGVAIFENSKVTRIVGSRPGHDAEAVTAEGSVHARFVVRATEGFTPNFAHQRRSVAPLFSLMIATEPQSRDFWDEAGFAQYETFADDRHLIIYGQRTSDDRFAFGGRGAPYHFGSTVEPRFDESPKVFALLEATLRELFPHLEGDVSHRWGGPLAMARDQSPSVIVDYESGLASAGGYTGDGVVMSYVAANALADLLAAPDVATEFTTLPFVHHRSKRWAMEPLRWLGINVALELANWSDRVEQRHGRESAAGRWLERLFD